MDDRLCNDMELHPHARISHIHGSTRFNNDGSPTCRLELGFGFPFSCLYISFIFLLSLSTVAVKLSKVGFAVALLPHVASRDFPFYFSLWIL